MKVYLFISNHKKLLKMYLPYIEALNKQLDITNSLVDADIVLVIGAWTWQGAQIASRKGEVGKGKGKRKSTSLPFKKKHIPLART